MFKIYNKNALTRKERFFNALVAGIGTSIVCVALLGLFIHFFHFYFSLFVVGIGWIIGYAIQKFGKGVQIQFSILAVVLTLIVIFIGDMMVYGSITNMINSFKDNSLDLLLDVIYRVAAVYFAYNNARVI